MLLSAFCTCPSTANSSTLGLVSFRAKSSAYGLEKKTWEHLLIIASSLRIWARTISLCASHILLHRWYLPSFRRRRLRRKKVVWETTTYKAVFLTKIII